MMTVADTTRVMQGAPLEGPERPTLRAPAQAPQDDDDAHVVIVYLLGALAGLVVLAAAAWLWGLR